MAVVIHTQAGGGAVPMSHARILWDCLIQSYAASLRASPARPGMDVETLRYPLTYEAYSPAAMPAFVTAEDFGPDFVDGVLIAGHNLGAASVRVKVSFFTTSTTTAAATVTHDPADNSPIMVVWDRPAVGVQKVTVSLEYGDDAPDDKVSPIISVLMVGKLLEMERPIFAGHTPVDLNRNVVVSNQRSIGGQALGFSVRRLGVSTDYQWQNITQAFLYSEFAGFKNHAELGRGFFGIAWRPSWSDAGVAYGSLNGEAISSSVTGQPDLYDVSFGFQSAGAVI